MENNRYKENHNFVKNKNYDNNNINTSNVLNIGYFKSKLITDIKLKHYINNMIYSNINVYNYRYKVIDSIDILDNINK